MNVHLAAATLCGMLTASAFANTTTINFDNGWEGFNGSGDTFVNPGGGNPGAHGQSILHDTFGMNWWTESNSAFVGDFSQYSSVTVTIDVMADYIIFFGSPVERNLILDMRSYSLGQNGYPWSSVWYNLGTIQGGMDWTTFSVTFDPNAVIMPAGWGGTGDEDPNTFEPILPANLTFADVLANVESFVFTTFEPGWFYGFTDFSVRIDNISITAVPIPAPGALALLALAGLSPRRRR